jgi:hypothetical protein
VWLLLGAAGGAMFGEATLGFYGSKNMVKKVCVHVGVLGGGLCLAVVGAPCSWGLRTYLFVRSRPSTCAVLCCPCVVCSLTAWLQQQHTWASTQPYCSSRWGSTTRAQQPTAMHMASSTSQPPLMLLAQCGWGRSPRLSTTVWEA